MFGRSQAPIIPVVVLPVPGGGDVEEPRRLPKRQIVSLGGAQDDSYGLDVGLIEVLLQKSLQATKLVNLWVLNQRLGRRWVRDRPFSLLVGFLCWLTDLITRAQADSFSARFHFFYPPLDSGLVHRLAAFGAQGRLAEKSFPDLFESHCRRLLDSLELPLDKIDEQVGDPGICFL